MKFKPSKFQIHLTIILIAILFLLYKRPDRFYSLIGKANPNAVVGKVDIVEATEDIPVNIMGGEVILFGGKDWRVLEVVNENNFRTAILIGEGFTTDNLDTFIDDTFTAKEKLSLDYIDYEKKDTKVTAHSIQGKEIVPKIRVRIKQWV